jgi:hypothetical protein
MGNSKDRRKLRRLIQQLGLSMPPKTPAAPKKSVSSPFWKRIPAWVYATAALFSIVITLAEGYPWLSIQRGGMLDSRNPFSEMFEISNGGYVPLTNLNAYCVPNFVAPHIHMENNTAEIDNFATYLAHNRTVTLPCFQLIRVTQVPSGARLDIAISYAFYHLNLRWLRRSQVFHFQSIRGEDGSQHWQFLS